MMKRRHENRNRGRRRRRLRLSRRTTLSSSRMLFSGLWSLSSKFTEQPGIVKESKGAALAASETQALFIQASAGTLHAFTCNYDAVKGRAWAPEGRHSTRSYIFPPTELGLACQPCPPPAWSL